MSSSKNDSNIIKREVTTAAGTVVLFEISNAQGAIAEFSNLGAGITRIAVPDRNGTLTDVALSYENIADYWYDSPCAGKTPGRFANRIASAKFTLFNKVYSLNKNDGENSLHGGPTGFHNRLWDYTTIDNGVIFTRLSPDGEEGYPGNLHVSVTYRWNDDNSLDIHYDAHTDAPTIINLTNHAYFNLNGCGNGDILTHKLTINGKQRVQSDSRDIPTGLILPVEGTPFDFRHAKEIGKDINRDFENLSAGKGFNHYYIIDKKDNPQVLHNAAELYSEKSGICLLIETTMPGVMLYTGNWLAQSPTGKNNYKFRDHDGVALECQFPPDAPNHPNFPSTILLPEKRYEHSIRYIFTAL